MLMISRKTLASEYGFSSRTIDRRIAEIELLEGRRYPPKSVLRTSSGVRIRRDVAEDYIDNRDAILKGAAQPFEEDKGL